MALWFHARIRPPAAPICKRAVVRLDGQNSVYGAYRTTSDLTGALIEGTNNNAFLIALPDGEYTVWLIASDAEWAPPLFEVWANGQKKLEVRIPF